MRSLLLCTTLCAALLAGGDLSAQQDASGLFARLVRCVPEAGAACLRIDVTLRPEEAARYAGLAGDAGNWTGSVGTDQLPPPVVTVPAHSNLQLRMLILVDVSGSMAGSGLEVTRSALRSFLFDLPDSVRVGIAPFQSRQVMQRIQSVAFVSRDSAFQQLESLPEPAGNTALYSAAALGVETLAAELDGLGADAWGGLLLITDGVNDVGNTGDDAGLLAGPDGREIAKDALASDDIQPWLVGIGANVSAAELTALAGPGGITMLAGTDPLELGRAFAAIQAWLLTEREFLFVLPTGARTRLAGRETPVELRFRSADGGVEEVVRTSRYRPPAFALPAFEGVGDASGLAESLIASPPGALLAIDPRWPLLLFFAALWLILWVAVPRVLWPIEVAEGAARENRKAAAAAEAEEVSGLGTGLRIDVEEAPPRSPADVTGEFRAVRR
jgi:Mg-chelatase subunit ChlD